MELIGEWNWSETLTMTRNGDVWSVDVELSEGLYCYKFIVDGAYIFDPSNPERVYCDDIENSLLRVDDHLRPHYTATLTDVALEVTYHAGSTGALHDGVPSALAGATWDDMTSTWTLPLSGLTDGKHTLKIEGFDAEGHPAYDLLVPFWTGPHAEFVWDDALVYMIMTDRFVNGNTSNDGTSTGAAQGADWQGGDFAGVTQMIESGTLPTSASMPSGSPRLTRLRPGRAKQPMACMMCRPSTVIGPSKPAGLNLDWDGGRTSGHD